MPSLLLALLVGTLNAAVIRGTVVENQTGRPLARALVALQSVPGTSTQRMSVRTNISGTFQFPPLPAGSYVLTASRTGFATFQYGQKRWNSMGVPVMDAADDSPLLTIRLPRMGAIEGTVLDENDVGLPDYDVVAYHNTRPPRIATRVKSDDRGVFRLFGLEPGSYLVRTTAMQYDEGPYLPTFSRETLIVDQAIPVEVDLDQQIEHVDVHPLPGRLYTLSVEVVPIPPTPPLPVTITLVSDTGRETVQAVGHKFERLPPGQYELFTQAPVERPPGVQGDYRRLTIAQDTSLKVVLHQVPELPFTFAGGPTAAAGQSPVAVSARRHDLAGESPPEVLKITNNRVQLAPGPWELSTPSPPGFYVSGFIGPQFEVPANGRVDGWNLITVDRGGPVRFAFSASPGTIHGTVRSGGDPVAGAPVFLESYDLGPARRITDPFVTRTDINGQFRFMDLAPGNYRVMSSFDYRVPDSQAMANAGAKPVKIEENNDALQDLDLVVVH